MGTLLLGTNCNTTPRFFTYFGYTLILVTLVLNIFMRN